GEVFTENLHNRRGNRENGRIVFLNDHLLKSHGGAWNDPVVTSTWTKEQAQERDAIVTELSSRGARHWGFKDPRALFTLPFWLEVLDKPRFIGTFRHPHRVALSLHNRDDSPVEAGWELWRRYNERLLKLADEHSFALVDFDADDTAYLDSVIRQLINLGLDPERAEQGRQFFDPALRNQAGAPVDVEMPAAVKQLYTELQARAAD
ncbi:MAG: hypothetical protein KJP03_09010, partial [Gammaproteobacteria bacterium]|nr:hypothetical protein [Gammaproteobacteria bacterium]